MPLSRETGRAGAVARATGAPDSPLSQNQARPGQCVPSPGGTGGRRATRVSSSHVASCHHLTGSAVWLRELSARDERTSCRDIKRRQRKGPSWVTPSGLCCRCWGHGMTCQSLLGTCVLLGEACRTSAAVPGEEPTGRHLGSRALSREELGLVAAAPTCGQRDPWTPLRAGHTPRPLTSDPGP